MRFTSRRLAAINGLLATLTVALLLGIGDIAQAKDAIQGCCRLDTSGDPFCCSTESCNCVQGSYWCNEPSDCPE